MVDGTAVTLTNIRELKKLFSGKVRDIYEVSDGRWLIVTTDRISAFDVVFREGIPGKGKILNSISNKWFKKINWLPNHILSLKPGEELPFLNKYDGILDRSVLVKRVNRLPVECVVRGYLFGSVYDEYKEKGTAGGAALPRGIRLAGKLPEPIFTPSTKAETGHDQNITYRELCSLIGSKSADGIIGYSIEIYKEASSVMEKAGIILADTKFEFGLDENGALILVDEVLTPDSSRYWDAGSYKEGISPKSYDKQFVRDYLNTLDWDKKPPPPVLPPEIISKTSDKYNELLGIIDRFV